MTPDEAIKYIDRLVFRPGWDIRAFGTDRFEDSITLRVAYPAQESGPANARKGYPKTIVPDVGCTLTVGDKDEVALYRAVVAFLVRIEEHEVRELLRVLPDYDAPLHPHTIAGMTGWCDDIRDDLSFGVA